MHYRHLIHILCISMYINVKIGEHYFIPSCHSAGLMSGSSDQLAVMRPAYMSLPSPNITSAEEQQADTGNNTAQPHEVSRTGNNNLK